MTAEGMGLLRWQPINAGLPRAATIRRSAMSGPVRHLFRTNVL